MAQGLNNTDLIVCLFIDLCILFRSFNIVEAKFVFLYGSTLVSRTGQHRCDECVLREN